MRTRGSCISVLVLKKKGRKSDYNFCIWLFLTQSCKSQIILLFLLHSPQLVIVLELADAGDLSRMIKVWLTHTQYCAKVVQTEIAEFHFLFFWNFIELSCKSWYKDTHLQLMSFCNNREQYFFEFLSHLSLQWETFLCWPLFTWENVKQFSVWYNFHIYMYMYWYLYYWYW